MTYNEQLQELGRIYKCSQKADNDDYFDNLLQELRELSNTWHIMKKIMSLLFQNILS